MWLPLGNGRNHGDDMARKALILEFKGKKLTLRQWSEKTGISKETIYQRINRLGWSVERALTSSKRVYVRSNKPVTLAKAA